MKILLFCCEPRLCIALVKQLETLGYETICAIKRNTSNSFMGNFRCLLYDYIDCDDNVNAIRNISADYIFSIVFDEKIPDRIIETARFHALNFHPALLPDIRTVNPWFWSVANADKPAAISVHKIESTWDSGDIAYVHKIHIGEHDTQGQYFHNVHREMPKVVDVIHAMIVEQNFTFTPQKGGLYYSQPTLKERYINWNASANSVGNLVRAGNPYDPVSTKMNNELVIVIHEVRLTKEKVDGAPGSIKVLGDRLLVATGDYMLEVMVLSIPTVGIYSGGAAMNILGITPNNRFENYENISLVPTV